MVYVAESHSSCSTRSMVSDASLVCQMPGESPFGFLLIPPSLYLHRNSIQHSYTVRERVPNWMLGVICFGVPTIIMPLANLFTVRSWWDWHN